MLAILVALALAALAAPLCIRRFGRNGFLLLALVPAGCLGWVLANWGTGQPSEDRRENLPWAPEIGMDLTLRLDRLAAIMALLVLGIGALILIYCARYFTDDEPRLGRFAAELVAFAGVMFGLVTSDNLLVLYTFWELTSALSFLLVGHYAERATSRRAATQALLVTTAGGLAMLVGIIMLGEAGGSYLLSDLVANPPSGRLVDVAVVAILVGALSKSAVVPMHFWLPGAMAAPTPVSAYLHAAAMVKAGVYLVARLAPGFAHTPAWQPTVVVLGCASLLLGGWRALQAYDLKLILAFGTVSQLGLLIVLVGSGTHDAALAGVSLMLAHAMFKAALFMVVGIIDHTTGTRDLRKLAYLGRRAPALAITATVAAFSMAGLPPTLGFVAKEAGLAALAPTSPNLADIATLAAVVLGSTLTVGYSVRLIVDSFGDKHRSQPTGPVATMHRPGTLFLTVPALLAAGGLAAGIAAPWVGRLVEPYARTLPGSGDYHLGLWHGFGLPLGLTVLAVAGGCAIYLSADRIRRFSARRLRIGNADRAYDAVLSALDLISLQMTSTTQRGSVALTQATILVTTVTLPSVVLLLGDRPHELELRRWDSPVQPAVGVLILAAALAATVLRQRLAAVLCIGITGYGCGVLFALHGAPDLALTQFLVETLTLVIFVLVLRKFPAELNPKSIAGHKVPRALLAITVGVCVPVLAIFATAARHDSPIALQLPDAAYHLGNGKNVVNVLLVDIRAWDTLGEISVLLVAATGVASLVFRSRRFGLAPRVTDAQSPPSDGDEIPWLRAGALLDPRYRSLVVEVTTRLLFPTIMVLSAYFFFAGHNAPGGGFAGGLTAGLALVLRYLAGGRYELGEALPVDAGQILGAGLICAAGTAAVSLLLGAPVLSSSTLEFELPLIGSVKLVTALFFDLGVYLIVVGLVLDVLRSLGARLETKQ
ncbi:Na+/H+ antiporter subunit A [Skermania piniformis]|uniref:Na+/H+ antiporter subunit A n=1 Tax=Skermania pinensis TaxID=39122 RepID=A0ABX8SCV9_9ACTN|nr:Na+/H+ antiporter subunit A [Skermania piniformis]QXQ14280.1 Na+/H+ antiporter subunit A [Skermania piniformis]